jgi:hypothetical protein
MSFVESITNVLVGFLLAVLTQITLFPMLDLQVSVADNLLIGMIFTADIGRAEFRAEAAVRVHPGSEWENLIVLSVACLGSRVAMSATQGKADPICSWRAFPGVTDAVEKVGVFDLATVETTYST